MKGNFENALNFFRSEGKTAGDNNMSREDLLEIGILGTEIDKMEKVANHMGEMQAEAFLAKIAETEPVAKDVRIKTEDEKKRKNHEIMEDDLLGSELNKEEQTAMKIVKNLLVKKQIENTDGTGEGETLTESVDQLKEQKTANDDLDALLNLI